MPTKLRCAYYQAIPYRALLRQPKDPSDLKRLVTKRHRTSTLSITISPVTEALRDSLPSILERLALLRPFQEYDLLFYRRDVRLKPKQQIHQQLVN